jgi:predicted acyltransferase
MVMGLIAGGCLLDPRWSARQRIGLLFGAGLACLFVGWLLGALGVCPVVKRIWTPSWVLFSGGWCLLLMALFYLVIDVWQRRAWCFPLLVIGLNSIAAYCLVHLIKEFIISSLKTHLGSSVFLVFGKPYEPLFLGGTTLFVLWLMLWWMYRRKIFLRI